MLFSKLSSLALVQASARTGVAGAAVEGGGLLSEAGRVWEDEEEEEECAARSRAKGLAGLRTWRRA